MEKGCFLQNLQHGANVEQSCVEKYVVERQKQPINFYRQLVRPK